MKSALAAAVSPSRRPRPRIGAIAKYWNTIPKAPMAPRPGLRAPATAPAPRAPGPSRHRPGPNHDDGAWVQLFWGEGWGGCGVFGDG
jgi:hypothetical protein